MDVSETSTMMIAKVRFLKKSRGRTGSIARSSANMKRQKSKTDQAMRRIVWRLDANERLFVSNIPMKQSRNAAMESDPKKSILLLVSGFLLRKYTEMIPTEMSPSGRFM